MSNVIVIADDLTGAAEIAGIGLRHGLTAALVPDATSIDRVPTDADVVVLNTDSRAIDARDAAARVRRLVPLVEAARPRRVFKKIDSVLRGNVRAEIDAFLDASTVCSRALVVPQNPSRGRTIDADGTYRIDGVPLDQTAFARDPDHPAKTANAHALVGADFGGITIGTGATLDDVRRHAASLKPDVLPVGGADFFTSILERERESAGPYAGAERTRAAPAPDAQAGAARVRSAPAYGHERVLFISGTADASTRATLVAELRRRSAPCAELPIAWFVGDRPSAHVIHDWARQFRDAPVAALLAPSERAEPSRVHGLLCDAAAALIDAPVSLYVDGGATAMALSRRMNWTAMTVVAEVGPGAVTLAPSPDITMTIKPGSYAWPTRVWETVSRS